MVKIYTLLIIKSFSRTSTSVKTLEIHAGGRTILPIQDPSPTPPAHIVGSAKGPLPISKCPLRGGVSPEIKGALETTDSIGNRIMIMWSTDLGTPDRQYSILLPQTPVLKKFGHFSSEYLLETLL